MLMDYYDKYDLYLLSIILEVPSPSPSTYFSAFPSSSSISPYFYPQKIKTLNIDNKTVKLQIVSLV